MNHSLMHVLERAMDASALRLNTIAKNLSNIHTPNYKVNSLSKQMTHEFNLLKLAIKGRG
jgi:flagellar basal body rod protein FlgB